jgi:hypothetical protein
MWSEPDKKLAHFLRKPVGATAIIRYSEKKVFTQTVACA